MSGQGVCSHCGGPVPPGGKFCENCGRPLAGAPPAPPVLPSSAARPPLPPALPAIAAGTAHPPGLAVPAHAPPALPPSAAGIGGPPGLPPPAFAARPRRRAGAWVAAAVVLVALAAAAVCFLPRSSSPARSGSPASTSERSAASLQRACDAKDCQAATALLHPAVSASYGKILKDHEAELPRLGKLLATRKLLIANADVAEYEVTEDGETFIITFEKLGDQWFLVGL